jgi:ribosomal protein S18 acetylase RimI-like enzyme
MDIKIIYPKTLQKRKTKMTEKMIYNNFIDLADNDKLGHSYREIKKLLSSNNVQYYICTFNDKIIGYLLGDIISVGDRLVFFINYIYVVKQFRGNQIGRNLLKLSIIKAKEFKLDGVMLICNTHDKYVFNWYKKNKFVFDKELKRNEKHDVLYLAL